MRKHFNNVHLKKHILATKQLLNPVSFTSAERACSFIQPLACVSSYYRRVWLKLNCCRLEYTHCSFSFSLLNFHSEFSTMSKETKHTNYLVLENYIGGKFVPCGKHLDSFDPSTGELYCKVPDSGPEEVRHFSWNVYFSFQYKDVGLNNFDLLLLLLQVLIVILFLPKCYL